MFVDSWTVNQGQTLSLMIALNKTVFSLPSNWLMHRNLCKNDLQNIFLVCEKSFFFFFAALKVAEDDFYSKAEFLKNIKHF